MTETTIPAPPQPSEAERRDMRRKARLSERLRANLQKRKAQIRARRAGDADERPDGLLRKDDSAGDS